MLDLGKTFLQSAERSPNALAIVDGDIRWTYSEWLLRIGALQRTLAQLGLKHGDHLVSVLQNRQEAATLHWACQFSGVVMTPLNWRAKPEEVQFALQDSAAKIVVYESISCAAVLQALIEFSKVIAVEIGCVDEANLTGLATPQLTPIPYADCISNLVEPVPFAHSDDLSLMLFTSGTTGLPKGVPRRHRAERMAALAHVAQNQYG